MIERPVNKLEILYKAVADLTNENFFYNYEIRPFTQFFLDKHFKNSKIVTKELIETAIQHDGDINKKNKDGNTPMHLAMRGYTNIKIIQLLHAHGADITIKNSQSQTPDMCLKFDENFSKEVIQWLIDHQHNINQQDLLEKKAILHRACDHYKNSFCWKHGKHIFDYEANQNRLEIIRFLLSNGANPNLQDKNQKTPLHIACEKKEVDEKLVRLLLENGADPNIETDDGLTPLYFLTSNLYGINKEAIELLLIHGANPNQKNKQGDAPLHWLKTFAGWANLKYVKLLGTYGADHNIRNIKNKSFLHKVFSIPPCDEKDYQYIVALIGLGFNPCLLDANQNSPIDVLLSK